MNPFFPYYGGKSRLAKRIVSLLPPHTVYCEPFAGSAAVLFAKGRPIVTNSHNYREVLNDKNGDIINLFRTMQSPGAARALIRRLQWTAYSRAEYVRAREMIRGALPGDYSDLDRAWAIFVCLHQSFGATIGSGWSFSTLGREHTSRWRAGTALKFLEMVCERLRFTQIDQDDAHACVDRWDSPQTCFYLDPPYPYANQAHYSGFSQADFEALIDLLTKIEGSAVLSCYDNPAVPTEWERHEFDVPLTARNKKGGKPCERRIEVVWVKPSAAEMRADVSRALDDQRQQKLFANM